MRQAWLVLAILAAAGNAHAKRIACQCPTRIVVPERGATGVPTNAMIWIIDADGRVSTTQPKLAPNSELVDDSLGVRFTTGADEDKIAPEPPREIYLGVTIQHDTGIVESISAFGTYSADTALVRIHIDDPTGAAEITTTPQRLFLCQPKLRLAPSQLRIEVTAIDLAGNQSVPYVARIEPSLTSSLVGDDRCGEGVYRYHRHNDHGFAILGFLFLYVIGVFVWLVSLVVRRFVANRGFEEPIPVLAAEEVVRRCLRWQVLWSAMLIAFILGLLTTHDEIAIIFVMCLCPHAGISLIRLFLLRRAQYLLGRPEPVAVRYGRWLDVTAHGDSVLVRAADRDFVVAKRSRIPQSVAQ